MDFAALMSKEIAKAKGPASSDKDKGKESEKEEAAAKYTRRAEAEAAREAAYRAEQEELETKRAARQAEKRRRQEEDAAEAREREDKRRRLEDDTRRRREEREAEAERARRKRLGLPELPPDDGQQQKEEEEVDEADRDLPEDELRSRLRQLGEPAALFAEAHRARLRRYRRLTTVLTDGPIPTTLQLVEERDMRVSPELPAADDRAARRWLFRQLASYFTLVLTEWGAALAREHAAAKKQKGEDGGEGEATTTTFAARAAASAFASSRDNMRPLFRKLESGDLPDDILRPVSEIVAAAQDRRYVDANDGYLRLSIGTAAWPIGVTMVGIHERSAREKLHDGSDRGHVMGDEVTRKYLQSIKRCLTYAQVRWPPDDIRQLMG